MAKPATAARAPQLAGNRFANSAVSLEMAPPASRLSLRANEKGVKSFERTLGFALPKKPKKSNSKGSRHALWLGPDEWLIIDEAKPDESLVPAKASPDFSAVDISHRNCAVIVSGIGAEATLSAGCPQDLRLAAFPVGACSRTVFGKAEIALYRTDEQTFRVEFWRSFAPYVWGYLSDAARDAQF
ncbi:sarcosine oxidase subunit gamma [Pseudahrensia aquimaris]|uniref:Sarcosine oxidase subunit gamma n=1 Tax=Pseudahrensia aquimaris TaxID=744461 RepID=A0ABW3FC52_9HYPH